MNISKVLPNDDFLNLIELTRMAFAEGDDANIDSWFSFDVMRQKIRASEGVCIKATNDSNSAVGVLYAQQENPINGVEGTEKWVIVLTAVDPNTSGTGVGSLLLANIEDVAKSKGCKKLFVYTTMGDKRVVRFYEKNGFVDAGYVKDYQHGKDNSAVFLLKYLS